MKNERKINNRPAANIKMMPKNKQKKKQMNK